MKTPTAEVGKFLALHRDFFDFLEAWHGELGSVSLARLISNSGCPEAVAILGIDLIKGFTELGGLSSPRIAGIVPRVQQLFLRAHALGVRDFVLLQDSHPADSPQFEAYGPHATMGSEEERNDHRASVPAFFE